MASAEIGYTNARYGYQTQRVVADYQTGVLRQAASSGAEWARATRGRFFG